MTRTVISAWSAVSPYGAENADFAAGVRSGTRPPVVPDPMPACPITGYDPFAELGPRSSAMDRITALSVVTTGRLLGRRAGVDPGTALVLGTNNGSVESVVGFTGVSLRKRRPYLVDPMRFPNTVMNCAAAQSAIWHQLRGPNATIAAGRASGLLALRYATRLHRSGRAEVIACGAVEELSTTRSWMEHHAAPDGHDRAPLGEGCAMVLLEPAGRPAHHGRAELAEVLSLAFAVAEPDHAQAALARCVRRVLDHAGESPGNVLAVATSGGEEEAAVTDVLGTGTPVRLCASELIGDTSAASAAFALTAVLALAPEAPGGRLALITAVDRDGALGCALLRLGGG